MTLTATLKWQNLDSTLDLNNKTRVIFAKGILTDGLLVPVAGQLQITVQPFTAVSLEGMFINADTGATLPVVAGQTSVVSILAKYNIGSDPTLSIDITEIGAYSLLPDKLYRLVVGTLTVSGIETQVDPSDIDYSLRDGTDQITRSHNRGRVNLVADLPTNPASLNQPGDFYIVTTGAGDSPAIYAWNGTNWVFITDSTAVAADLAQHRANLFPNEIHLTNNQADAALGSFGSPAAGNPYVTSTDPRVPTLSEAQALPGSDGSPGSTNLYITQAYPVTAPTTLFYPLPPGGTVTVSAVDGPFYVGTGAIGTANQFFAFMDPTANIGYVNPSLLLAPQISGVFKDVLLTQPLDPSADADVLGYFASDLYLQLAIIAPINTAFRLIYGKRLTLKTIPKDFTVNFSPDDEYVPAKVVESLVNIKGRPYGTLLQAREQNINLRLTLDDVQSYLGSVLDTNVVASLEDFQRLKDQPVYGANFTENVGISPVYQFQNSGLVSFTYATGTISYAGAVNLASVTTGSLFRDSAGVFYQVTSIGVNSLGIVDVNTGLIPIPGVVNVSAPGTLVDGSVSVNFNPRNLLLSEMKLLVGSEIIKTNKLMTKLSEFSTPEGMITYGVERYPGYTDPRVAFYGGWENFPPDATKSYVRNKGASGIIDVTGFFTGVALLLRRKTNGPNLNVSVNRGPSTTVSTSGANAFNSNVAAMLDDKYCKVKMVSGLTATQPNNVRMSIAAETADDLEVFGIELFRDNSPALGLLESGRAFDATNLVKRNTVDSAVVNVPVNGGIVTPAFDPDRGARAIYTLSDNSYNISQPTLSDIPHVTTSGSGTTFSFIANSMENYRVNDLVILDDVYNPLTVSYPTISVIRRITALTSTTVTVDADPGFGAPIFRHLASTGGTYPFIAEETEEARYNLTTDFNNATTNDFEGSTAANRFVLSRDGLTLVAGKNLSVVTTGLNGAGRAVNVTSTGAIKFTVLATRLDIVTANEANATGVSFTVDGSPGVAASFTGGASRRQTLFSNSRYQTHEVTLTDSSGNLCITEIILFAPARPTVVGVPPETADLVKLAAYEPSDRGALLAQPNTYLQGGVFFEASSYISNLNGTGVNTDWSVATDFTKSLYGRYISTVNDGATAEFYFLGDSFELQYITGPDHGIFKVFVDGTDLAAVGGATVVGNYSGSQVDGYSATYSRANVGAYNLPYGYHKVTAAINFVRTKNGASTDYRMAFTGYYVTNANGNLSWGIDRGGTYSGIVDARKFLPFNSEDVQAANTFNVVGDKRAAKFAVPLGAQSVSVTFSNPLPDANYIVSCMFYNSVDTYPEFQPVVVTSQSAAGFTASWNSPLTTANAQLSYLTELLN